MAKLRVTRELLEYALDLPEGVTITAISGPVPLADGTEVIELQVVGDHDLFPDPTVTYACGYDETENGMALVEAVPV